MIVTILGWLIHVGEILIGVNLLTLFIAAFVKRFRSLGGGLLFVSAGVWALTLTLWCAVTVYSGWGWFLTVLGLALGIAGIIPVAFFCLLLGREWLELLELLFQIALVFGGWHIAKRFMVET